MSTTAAEHREADLGFRVLLFSTVAILVIGFVSGILQTYYVTQMVSGERSTAMTALSVPRTALQLLSLLSRSTFIYGLWCLYRNPGETRAATPALVALLLLGLELCESLGYMVAPEATHRLVGGQRLALVMMLMSLGSYTLLVIAIARRTARPLDLVLVAVPGCLLCLELFSFVAYQAPFRLAGEGQYWLSFAIRQAMALAMRGCLIYGLLRAGRELATLQQAKPSDAQDALASGVSEAESGQRMVVTGAIWLVGGLIVTIASYAAASSGTGGRYVVTYGAVVYGIAQIIRGLSRRSR